MLAKNSRISTLYTKLLLLSGVSVKSKALQEMQDLHELHQFTKQKGVGEGVGSAHLTLGLHSSSNQKVPLTDTSRVDHQFHSPWRHLLQIELYITGYLGY
jgi:hypothetical protein